MMILAMAMGHTVDRPVMRMGGGTRNPMERLCQLPSDLPDLDRKVNHIKSALQESVRILSFHRERNRSVNDRKERSYG